MGVRQTKQPTAKAQGYPSRLLYPFSAIAGQVEMKLALILNVIDPQIGGVLIMGHRGTGKSSAVRALADLLPLIWVVCDCPYRCDPSDIGNLCLECNERLATSKKLTRERQTVPVVDLPLGATEDRVCGTIDIERALRDGWKTLEPGLLARANRGFLYVDEVNLLEDHLVDLLLDVSVTGVNRVERESISIEHPAKFVLIGSGNPEEGELRPQLLDRFGLHVEVETEQDPERRLEVLERHQLFATDPETFLASFRPQQIELQKRIDRARKNMGRVRLDRPLLRQIAQLSSELKVDGHRGELTIARAIKALAAFEGRSRATEQDVRRVAPMALQHRLRRDPLEETGASRLIQEALEKVFTGQRPRKQISGNNESGSEPSSESNPDEESLTDPSTLKRQVGVYPFQKADKTSNSQRHSANEISSSLENSHHGVSPPVREGIPPKLLLKDCIQLGRSFQGAGHPGDRGLARVADWSRGRYVTAVVGRTPASRIAIDATLRAAAATGATNPLALHSDSLRFKHFTRRRGSLFIFAIDTSGSMAAKRIDQAKSAALGLLRQSYLRRDEVTLVAFRGTSAQVVLPPSRSILRARRVLDSLPVGGSTPMSAAVVCALKLAKRQKNRKVVLLLFTDGRANVSLQGDRCNQAERLELIKNETRLLGAELGKAGVTTVVVETQNGFWLTGGARELAERLRAQLFEVGDTVGRKKTGIVKEVAS
jgi:magnesium chelatase subunit D